MAENEELGADPLEMAKRFIRDHKEQVDSWFKYPSFLLKRPA